MLASRMLDAVYPDGTVAPISVQVGMPGPHADNVGDWVCPCRILGLGDSDVWTMYGVDSLQAVSQAIELLRRVLADFAREEGLTFTWGIDTGLDVFEVLW
jgi:hypothetical protein